jgi:hypothetical protein
MAALAEALRTSCRHRSLLPTTVKGESSSTQWMRPLRGNGLCFGSGTGIVFQLFEE